MFKHDDMLEVQLLEFDLALSIDPVSENFFDQLIYEISHVLALEYNLSRGQGRIPFSSFKPAPDKFEKIWNSTESTICHDHMHHVCHLDTDSHVNEFLGGENRIEIKIVAEVNRKHRLHSRQ